MSSVRILGLAAAALLAAPALALAQAAPPMNDQGAAPAASQPDGASGATIDNTLAPSATTNGANASGVLTSQSTTDQNGATVTNTLVTNGPVPDTAANRAKYGSPMSNAGKRTAPAGN
jgi:hypothetical protein